MVWSGATESDLHTSRQRQQQTELLLILVLLINEKILLVLEVLFSPPSQRSNRLFGPITGGYIQILDPR